MIDPTIPRFSDLIIFQDPYFIALNKPAGMPSQEDKSGDVSLLKIAEQNVHKSLKIVNRLDRPSSGIVIFGKKDKSTALLNQQLRERSVVKRYWAIVDQKEISLPSKIESKIIKDAKLYKARVDEDKGKTAVTHIIEIAKSDRYTLLSLTPETGYFHQIRIHLSSIGYPIKGDVKYGSRRSNKDRSIHLHCRYIELKHPKSQEPIKLTADPNTDDTLWRFFLDQYTSLSSSQIP